ncbi:hypothetical protein BD410DRAFT_794830 [Rickenella mellea]|uniref:Uncharacterized protein n=1 Tax=Rickenella mellea TaxID=50990 RepID=A0A4Y7PQX8_9AGAM|nr:hypothetical protein BD410DRAFT_794830 [Rickenella mellea]
MDHLHRSLISTVNVAFFTLSHALVSDLLWKGTVLKRPPHTALDIRRSYRVSRWKPPPF